MLSFGNVFAIIFHTHPRVFSELCKNYLLFCQDYAVVGTNMSLFHKISQVDLRWQIMGQCGDNQSAFHLARTNVPT